MPRYRKDDWTYYHRKTKDGSQVLYYRTYDENGRRTTGRSTGTSDKRKAERYVRWLERKGHLVPVKTVTFKEFTKNFYVWGKCDYIAHCQSERKRTVSIDSAVNTRLAFCKHILPFFEKMKIGAITEETAKAFVAHLRTTTKLSDNSIYQIVKISKIAFSEAVRKKIIRDSPMANIKVNSGSSKPRGILELHEVRQLLNPDQATIDKIWGGDRLNHAFNYLAATTGCRKCELIALKVKDVHPEYVNIAHSWRRMAGVKDTTKNGESRIVPIPVLTYDVIKNIIPSDDPSAFVFSTDGGQTRYYEGHILPNLYAALRNIGITEESRVARNICFHSWRHFLNTYLLCEDVAEAKVRTAIGHKTPKMTQRYAHLVLKNLKSVLAAQEGIIPRKDESNGEKPSADQE